MIIPGQKFNFNRLKKAEILWLYNNYCVHRHRYTDHPACYFKERPPEGPVVERVGFLDIETSNLHASFGFIFSYAIKELDGNLLGRALRPSEIRKFNFDKHLMGELCQDLRRFDRIITYYGKDYRFDVPYVRTRAILHGHDFPKYKELIVNDLYDIVRRKLRLHRNRLETACEFFGIPCKEHRLDANIWQKANAGEKESLEWIWKHNVEDVNSTEALWKKLHEFVLNSNLSI